MSAGGGEKAEKKARQQAHRLRKYCMTGDPPGSRRRSISYTADKSRFKAVVPPAYVSVDQPLPVLPSRTARLYVTANSSNTWW